MTARRTTLSIPSELMDEAKKYDLNISKAASAGIAAAIDREKKIRELGL